MLVITDFQWRAQLPKAFSFLLLFLNACMAEISFPKRVDSLNPRVVDQSSFNDGTHLGTILGNSILKLDPAGTPTNHSELDASWTPRWGHVVGYWKLNEEVGGTAPSGEDFEDSSSYGNHGTQQNNPTFGVDGQLSKSVEFTAAASTSILVEDQPELRLSQFTMSIWANLSSLASGQILLGKGDNYFMWYDHVHSPGMRVEFFNAAGLTYRGIPQDGGAQWTPDVNRWYHFVSTWDGSIVRLYANGELVSETGTIADTPITNSQRVRIGYGDVWARPVQGRLDDAAIWNVALSASEVKAIYERQSPKFSGIYTSRLMDADTSSSWTDIKWLSSLPFFKELPDYANGAIQNESSRDYASLVGSTGTVGDDNLMSGIAGLWHFNETALDTLPAGGDFKDSSGNGIDLSADTAVGTNKAGQFSRAIRFDGSDGSDDLITFPSTFNPFTNNFSIAFWANVEKCSDNQSLIFHMLRSSGAAGGASFRFGANPATPGLVNPPCYWAFWNSQEGGSIGFAAPTPAIKYKWEHVVVNFVRSSAGTGTATMYINAQSVGSSTGNMPIPSGNLNLYMGVGGGTDGYRGRIDDLGIWTRTLHVEEVKQLYQRGASRVKFQIRSCAQSPCNETTEPWRGPDGTNGTYFSELHNNSVPELQNGNVLSSLAHLFFSDFSSLSLPDRRYFQYRSILEADDSDITLGPDLNSVTIGPEHTILR
jgi:hypothetical protein